MAATNNQNPREFAHFKRVCGAWTIEALQARFEEHRFAAHTHDTWSIGAVISGAKDISAKRGGGQVFQENQVYCLPPDSPHAGRVVGKACEYVMLYVPDGAWREQCESLGVDLRQFQHRLPADTRQARRAQAFVDRIFRSPEAIGAWAGEWSLFCESLLDKYRSAPRLTESASSMRADPALARAYEYLHEFWNRNVSLSDLSRESSMTTSDVCRRFSAAYGLSPHRYQLVLRVMEAKVRLLMGAEISEVASETGFADQSHFGRHFKSILGVTPGTVAKGGRRHR
ncbi:AraC family transcriptional regulator [Paraburkholderia azotifigens]|uniref:AraC family transcriptional regulator n=2 Tax=Paraburkholderia azotifigens TaxID=2057004 RepID=A0A5C6VNY6_9BURK|nr:AraC family transcriptional regulator [Paraburkholderia azotifigens]